MTSGDPLDMAYKRGHRTLEKLDRVLQSHVQGKSLPLSLSLLSYFALFLAFIIIIIIIIIVYYVMYLRKGKR